MRMKMRISDARFAFSQTNFSQVRPKTILDLGYINLYKFEIIIL